MSFEVHRTISVPGGQGHVPSAEGHRRAGQAVVMRQADDLGGPEAAACRPYARAAVRRLELRPAGPVVTWTGCQFRFRTSLGSSSTLRVIVASARVTLRVSGG
jgi:hypothetical protein